LVEDAFTYRPVEGVPVVLEKDQDATFSGQHTL
jgi:hypothetical protein